MMSILNLGRLRNITKVPSATCNATKSCFEVSFRKRPHSRNSLSPSPPWPAYPSLALRQLFVAVQLVSMVKVFKPSKVAIVLSYVALAQSPSRPPRPPRADSSKLVALPLAVVSLAARSSLSASRMRELRWAYMLSNCCRSGGCRWGAEAGERKARLALGSREAVAGHEKGCRGVHPVHKM